jgi:hypothetical protein
VQVAALPGREVGDDGAGAADASATGDFDSLTGMGAVMQCVDVGDGLLGITRKEEVGPVDPLLRRGQLVLMTSAESRGAEIEAVVRCRSIRCAVAKTAATHPGAVGQSDRAGQCRVGHGWS